MGTSEQIMQLDEGGSVVGASDVGAADVGDSDVGESVGSGVRQPS